MQSSTAAVISCCNYQLLQLSAVAAISYMLAICTRMASVVGSHKARTVWLQTVKLVTDDRGVYTDYCSRKESDHQKWSLARSVLASLRWQVDKRGAKNWNDKKWSPATASHKAGRNTTTWCQRDSLSAVLVTSIQHLMELFNNTPCKSINACLMWRKWLQLLLCVWPRPQLRLLQWFSRLGK